MSDFCDFICGLFPSVSTCHSICDQIENCPITPNLIYEPIHNISPFLQTVTEDVIQRIKEYASSIAAKSADLAYKVVKQSVLFVLGAITAVAVILIWVAAYLRYLTVLQALGLTAAIVVALITILYIFDLVVTDTVSSQSAAISNAIQVDLANLITDVKTQFQKNEATLGLEVLGGILSAKSQEKIKCPPST